MQVPAGDPPGGVVTFLFTDIEGSTRRWESDADAMRAALAAHDKVLRTTIDAHGGYVFSHSGDGMAAAFSSPMSAVGAAIDAQRELQLPVRMGIATGEAELRDDDYFGTVLNRAARLMAAGHGGQILVAESTAGLLSGIELLNLGPRRLRDVANPVTMFQLQAPGLRTDFPPLRTVDPKVGNLRTPASNLIGRDAEIREIASVLRQRRLVTLTGVGGVGKTRLALEVAAQVADEFPDGVWVIELAAVNDPAAVPDAVAASLGVTQQPGMGVGESVAAALEGRVRLLVFDNCEHVLDAAAELIEAIIAASSTVRIIATSREGLSVTDEQVWPLRSLDAGAATELFEERARSVAPNFSAEGTDAVAEICARLDGIPLAIELAASRMASMSASDVRDRLHHRFKLLVGSRRGLERHQTLRHAVAWSYDLLDEADRALLDRCSVFGGGFDLESACAVAGSEEVDEYRVLDRLDALVRKSLLIADRSTGRTRYSMLETIRQFAEDQLVASGAAPAARTAHSRYFAGREPEIMALWDSPRQRGAYEWFATELANLRSAFRWAADEQDLDTAATIATFVGFIAFFADNYEPIAWVEELIEPARAADHPRLAWLYLLASVCYQTGRSDQGVAYAEAIPAAKHDGYKEIPFGFEGLAGGVYMMFGQPERYAGWCREFIQSGRDTHGMTRSALVNALVFAGARAEAVSAATGVVETAEATGNPWALSYALLSVAWVYDDVDTSRAIEAARRGIGVTRESGNRFNESHLAAVLATLEVKHGDPLEALSHLTHALRNYQDAGSVAFYHSPIASLAVILERLEHFDSAATLASVAVRNPMVMAAWPEIAVTTDHLQEILGAQAYEALARESAAMTPAAVVAYAYEQIDRARIELERSA
ncbi:adenylate/guanylate cyclase domain-containing protein [Mycolicibacterium tusciae]|uniref:adenylate/guanylate cyclase domain-containing protein n=1 Tax=Mycolicibacterium tusciae TaxID=75922 RepID=UPI0009F59907|nr:adenylate/guanylate cyclase domain-containing protein [Mycolicibacterium tusciae]